MFGKDKQVAPLTKSSSSNLNLGKQLFQHWELFMCLLDENNL